MSEQTRCHICGKKIKNGEERCIVCKPDPAEQFVADCRATRHVNFLITQQPLNLVLTDRRLLFFEDLRAAAVAAGAGGGFGLLGAAIGSAVGQSVSINGSLKMEVPLSSIVNVDSENKKSLGIVQTQITINLTGDKPIVVKLGASANNAITGEMFRNRLLSAISH